MEKDLHSVVNREVRVSEEERQKLLANSKLFCLFVPNQKAEDYKDVVHAGFIATLFDNLGGILAFFACENKPVATASVTVNYRKPIRPGEEYLTEVSTKKIDENKAIVNGVIKDKEGTVYAEADLMFIKVHWKNMVLSNIIKNIEEKILWKGEEDVAESRNQHIYMNVPDIIIDMQIDTKRKYRVGEGYAKF